MQVVALNNSINNNHYNDKISFKADFVEKSSAAFLSKTSKRLIQCMNLYIENTWADIKAGKILQTSPKYAHKTKAGDIITITPLYAGNRQSILMEIDDGRFTDRIVIGRKIPNNVFYERIIQTDHGSATIKSFNSQNSQSFEFEKMINDRIESIFPKILPVKILREGFGKSYNAFLDR